MAAFIHVKIIKFETIINEKIESMVSVIITNFIFYHRSGRIFVSSHNIKLYECFKICVIGSPYKLLIVEGFLFVKDWSMVTYKDQIRWGFQLKSKKTRSLKLRSGERWYSSAIRRCIQVYRYLSIL